MTGVQTTMFFHSRSSTISLKFYRVIIRSLWAKQCKKAKGEYFLSVI